MAKIYGISQFRVCCPFDSVVIVGKTKWKNSQNNNACMDGHDGDSAKPKTKKFSRNKNETAENETASRRRKTPVWTELAFRIKGFDVLQSCCINFISTYFREPLKITKHDTETNAMCTVDQSCPVDNGATGNSPSGIKTSYKFAKNL